MRRSSTRGLILAGIVACASSCTALLGLDDKPFTGEGTGGDSSTTTTGTAATATTTGSGGAGGASTATSTTTGAGGDGGTGGVGGGSLIWAVSSHGSGTHTLGGIAIAPTGEIWVVGSFVSLFSLPGCPQITSNAGQAVFVAKLGPGGTCQQLRMLTGVSAAEPMDVATGLAIAIDQNGNPAIAGSFKGTLEDPKAPGTPLLSMAMTQDIFVARLDPVDGHVTDKHAYGGDGDDQINSLVFDDGNDLYAAGWFQSTFIVPTEPEPTSLVAANANAVDGLLLKLSPGGEPIWGKRMGAVDHASVIMGVTFISSAQGVAITGKTGGTVTGVCDFGASPATSADVFFAVIDKAGDCMYSALGNATDKAIGRAIDSDSFGRIVAAGDLKGMVDLGASPPLTSFPMETDGFVARVDWNHGVEHHAAAIFGNGGNMPLLDQAAGLYVDAMSRIAVTGSYQQSTDFSGTVIPSQGSSDAFVASYDPELGLRWVKGFGDASFQQGISVAVDPSSFTVVAAGNFLGTLTNAGAQPPEASVGLQSIFVIKLVP